MGKPTGPKLQGLPNILPPKLFFFGIGTILADTEKKTKKNKYWAIKIFFISFILAAAVSVVAEYFTQGISLYAAFAVLILIVALGVIADTIGVAFATCEHKPFIAMSAKRMQEAKVALELLKNADVVSNFCNDVIGDICGIVSGAAGAAIAVQVVTSGASNGAIFSESLAAIALSSLIAAVTVAGKAVGKTIALKSNKDIVLFVGRIISFFKRKDNL